MYVGYKLYTLNLCLIKDTEISIFFHLKTRGSLEITVTVPLKLSLRIRATMSNLWKTLNLRDSSYNKLNGFIQCSYSTFVKQQINQKIKIKWHCVLFSPQPKSFSYWIIPNFVLSNILVCKIDFFNARFFSSSESSQKTTNLSSWCYMSFGSVSTFIAYNTNYTRYWIQCIICLMVSQICNLKMSVFSLCSIRTKFND